MLRSLGFYLIALATVANLGLSTATAEKQPILVVTISSVADLLSDVGYLAEATGNGQYGQMAGAIAQGYIQGLDNSRPIAIIVNNENDEIKSLGILPIKDLDQFLAGLAQQLGEPQDAGDGVLELAGPAPMFIKEQGGWAYVAQNAADLGDLPDDPMSQTAGLTKKFDVGFIANIQNIPQMYRDMALEQIKEGVQAQMDMMPDEEGNDVELQRKLVENQVRQWEAIFNEVEQIRFGWKTDQENGNVQLDSSVVAVPGTRTARQMASIRDATTDFAGFYRDDAAVSVRSSGRFQQQDIDQALAMMGPMREKVIEEIEDSDKMPNDAAKEVAKKLAVSLLDVVEATLKEGVSDGAITVNMDNQDLTVVAGMHVANGEQIEDTLKELNNLAEQNPDFPEIEFNTDQHAGVRFHKLALPIEEDDDDARQVFGDAIALTVGVGPKKVYLGLGDNAKDALIQAMNGSEAEQSVNKPAEMYVALGKIMDFAAQFSDEPAVEAMAEELATANGSDRVLMTVTPIDNGAQYHFELREGILKAIGAGIQAQRLEAAEAGG